MRVLTKGRLAGEFTGWGRRHAGAEGSSVVASFVIATCVICRCRFPLEFPLPCHWGKTSRR